MFRRRRRYEPYKWVDLATYNAEVSRGVVHTPEFAAQMALRQAEFDAEARKECEQEGVICVEADPRRNR